MRNLRIHNARIWNADAATLFDGAVEITGNRISAVLRGADRPDVIDAAGQTLMPGMVIGHCTRPLSSS